MNKPKKIDAIIQEMRRNPKRICILTNKTRISPAEAEKKFPPFNKSTLALKREEYWKKIESGETNVKKPFPPFYAINTESKLDSISQNYNVTAGERGKRCKPTYWYYAEDFRDALLKAIEQ